MKHLLSLMTLLLIAVAPAGARGGEKVRMFAETVCEKAEILEGDSTLVSIIVYADVPFTALECTDKAVKASGAAIRAQAVRQMQQQVVRDGRRYYAIVANRLIVRPLKPGELTIPALHFQGSFEIADEPYDPRLYLWGKRPKSHTERQKCRSTKKKLRCVKKPLRTTQEIQRSGGNLL
ncbi:MAG: hypothetical protein ACI353_01390 [Alloprevotella sp.]